MRIVLVCDWFLKYSSSQAEGLARAGADVLLLCRHHGLEFAGDMPERERTLDRARAAGVTVVETPGRLWDVRATGELWGIRRRLARFAPDVIHAQSTSADPRALLLLPRAPVVLTDHDPVFHPGQPVAAFAPKRWFLDGARAAWRARASLIVIHSEHLRHELVLRPGQPYAVLPHGLYASERPLPVPAERVVGFYGRLAPYKGLAVLARAMPRVWASRPDVRLLVAGAGPEEIPVDDPRAEVRRGYVPQAEVEAFFAGVSIAVLPYTQASQTGAGSEAIGFGVPVIVSRAGGLPDIALDSSYIVEPGDESGLAAAIIRHIDDGDDVRTAVLARVAANHTWDAVGLRSLELYEGLLARRRAKPTRRRRA